VSEEAEVVVEEPTEAELIQQFLMWVDLIIHDTESVSDTKNERYWCPQWWAHPEAVNRLNALHAAYGQAVADDTVSAWWIQHWDSHARVLFSQHGPFSNCQSKHTFYERSEEYAPRLVTVPPPPQWAP
jgi:hypothetical protein